MIQVIIMAVIFTAYIGFVWKKFGVLGSISESYYKFKEQESRLFMFFTWALAAPMFTYETGWYFGSGVFLCFCGTASAYKEKMTSAVHYVGASGSIILATIGLLHEAVIFPMVWGIIASVLLSIFKVSNRTWWIEIAWFILIMIGLTYR